MGLRWRVQYRGRGSRGNRQVRTCVEGTGEEITNEEETSVRETVVEG